MSAQQYLQSLGVSFESARNFINTHLNRPDIIYSACDQYGITNAMLAEITGYAESDVRGFWALNGYDPDGLEQAIESMSVYMPVQLESWNPEGFNSFSYQLAYPVEVRFEGVSVTSGGAFSTEFRSAEGMASGRVEGLSSSDDGLLTFEFSLDAEDWHLFSVSMHDIRFNGQTLDSVVYDSLAEEVLRLTRADGLEPLTRITETPDVDSAGYDTSYSNIEDVLSLPENGIITLEAGVPQQAYVHVMPGDWFVFDHDTFVFTPEPGADYRLKITPDDPGVFTSNKIAWLYGADGEREDLVMNLVDGFHSDGALYSDRFDPAGGGEHFLSLSMRWAGEYGDVAEGPEPYTIELLRLEDNLL